MSDKVAFFLPTRKGSERVKNKTHALLLGMKVVWLKLNQTIVATKHIDEILFPLMMRSALLWPRNTEATVD